MNTYWHLLFFNREWTRMADEKLLLAQHTAQGRVGRRVAPESASKALSARNDGEQRFSELAML
jgi:hypothetical protein